MEKSWRQGDVEEELDFGDAILQHFLTLWRPFELASVWESKFTVNSHLRHWLCNVSVSYNVPLTNV